MVNYFIYAKDYSGSTRRVQFYHNNGLKTLEQFKSDVDKIKSELSDADESKIIYLHWGNQCEEVDEEKTVKAYEQYMGEGSDTLPQTIIEWLKNNIESDGKIRLLYIITDGQTNSRNAYKCLRLNENMNYENVVFHALNEYTTRINLSVTASFLKGHCTIHCNNELIDETDISQEFDYDKITTQNFTTEKEILKSYIKYKFLNTRKSNSKSLAEIEKLKKMRNRLFHRLGSGHNTVPDTRDKITFLSDFVNTQWYTNFCNPSYDLKLDIEKSITTLINYIVDAKKSYDFDNLKFDIQFSNDVPEEPIEDVTFAADLEIEFPDIILDDEKGVPVILFTELNLLDKLIFHNSETTASFSKFKSTMECPLFLLDDSDLNDSIGYFYTLNVYKKLLETTKMEPRTRRSFHGGLVLVDTDDFDKYNDYIISATYFNFKKVKYNVGLFYFVLWKICEKKQWMAKNVVEQFKQYMLRRISKTKCKIGLSSLPLDPPMYMSLPTALWYCVELSSLIFKDDPNRFFHERLRMYYGVAESMIEILKYFNYNLDMDTINKRRDMIRHVMILKKIQRKKHKVWFIAISIFKKSNDFLVCEIENQNDIKKLNYLKLDHKEMLNDDVIMEQVNFEDYFHFFHCADNQKTHVKICDKTFRPFFTVNQNVSFYSEFFKFARQVVVSNVEGKIELKLDAIDKLDLSKILSLYNLFIHCVKHCDKFPTLEEYKDYILKKKMYKDNLVSIFSVNILSDIEVAFKAYQNVIKDVEVKDFINVCDKYVNRFERIKAEERKQFKNDDEILNFISEEERKVSLTNTNKKT